MSHELKTPVTRVKAYRQLLTRRFRTEGDEQAVTLLGKMDAQLNKLTRLIDDLLERATIEAGKQQTHRTSFTIDELVRAIVEEMQRTTQTHRMVIEREAHRQVYADRERLGQVLTNLLTNAIKYSPQAETIRVSTEAHGEMITVSVQDEGMGISQDKQAHIFERFFRVDGPERETIAGLGLGLYISAEIVKEQGGEIRVESTPGKGSTFSFTIPCPTAQPALAERVRKREHL